MLTKFMASLAVLSAGALFAAGAAHARDLPNFDILEGMAASAPLNKATQVLPDGVERVSRDSRLGMPEFLWFKPVANPGASRRPVTDVATSGRNQLRNLASMYGMTTAEVDAASLLYTQTLRGGASLVRFANQVDGVVVFGDEATVLLDAHSQPLNISGSLGGSGRSASRKATPVSGEFSPAKAVAVALQDFEFAADVAGQLYEPAEPVVEADSDYRWLALPESVKGAQGGVLTQPARYRPVWFRLADGLVSAYYVEIAVREDGEFNAHSYVIARSDGQILFRNNQRSHELPVTADKTYSYSAWADPQTGVPYTGPSENHDWPHPAGKPNGYSMPLMVQSSISLSSGPFRQSATDPWLDGTTNQTKGNNVDAFADLRPSERVFNPGSFSLCDPANSPPTTDIVACTTADKKFELTYDFNQEPLSTRSQVESSVVNQFYTINWLHDWFYDAGFDEPSRNAQSSNFSRGGNGNDPIKALALDYNGTDNAWMSTPADGGSPTMAMYRYTGRKTSTSSAMDNAVVAHEWGHFITNRLIFNANGLYTDQARALGEGWGDFLALLLSARSGSDQYQGGYASAAYSGGSYFDGEFDPENQAYFGARRYPYSTDFGKNPLTYKHIVGSEGWPIESRAPINQQYIGLYRDYGYADDAINPEVHATGEVWGNMLWGCYVSLLNRHPFEDARTRMRDYLVAGLKLTPQNPTFVSARNALLAAMQASDADDASSCSAAFAWRGLGSGAVASTNFTTHIGLSEAFDATVPLVTVESVKLSMKTADGALSCDADDWLDNGEKGFLKVQLLNRGGVATSTVQLQLKASDTHLVFMDGASQTVSGSFAAGEARTILIPVTVSGLATAVSARIDVTASIAGTVGTSQSGYTDTWLNADSQMTTSDSGDAWPSKMASTDPRWVAPGMLSQPWYHASVRALPSNFAMYTPALQASATEDLVVTFDQDFEFVTRGPTNYNGGVLVVREVGGTAAYLSKAIAGYTNGAVINSSSNPLVNKAAYVGTSGGWQRNVTINLGKTYAGKQVQLGWRFGAALDSPARARWDIDNIRVAGVDNQPFHAIVTNAKTCSRLERVSGSPQATPVGQSFASPLKVKVVDLAGLPISMPTPVVFTAPANASGVATAAFSATDANLQTVSILSGANGLAQTTALFANAVVGSYQVSVATDDPDSMVAFDLENKELAGTIDANEFSFSGPSANGTVKVAGSRTQLPSGYFSNGQITAPSTQQLAQLPGHEFPYDLASFVLENVGTGTVQLVITYPQNIPDGAQFWYYAPTAAGGSPQWQLATWRRVAGGSLQSIIIDVKDASLGDSDLLQNGRVSYVGGISVVPSTSRFNAISGTPQSAPVNTAFAQSLRVRLLDASSTPIADAQVTFTAPATGASARFANGLANEVLLTDANGYAQSSAITANAVVGEYNVTVSTSTQTQTFVLRNTHAAVDGGGTGGTGGMGPLFITGPAPDNKGPVTITVVDSEAALPAAAYFSRGDFTATGTASAPNLPGYEFPFGVVAFALENVGEGNSVTFTAKYPAKIPEGAAYWKYGHEVAGDSPHWYTIDSVPVDEYTLRITLRDGVRGDDDLRENGAITDPGGIAIPKAGAAADGGAVAVPASTFHGLALISLALLAAAGTRREMRRRKSCQ